MAQYYMMWIVPFVCLYLLQVTPPSSVPSAPIIEPAAETLLAENKTRMSGLLRYSAECRTTVTRANSTEYELATVTLLKPNRLRYDCWKMQKDPATGEWKKIKPDATFITTANDKEYVEQLGISYERLPPRITKQAVPTGPWNGFFDPSTSEYGKTDYSRRLKWLREIRLAGTDTVDGVTCSIVSLKTVAVRGGRTLNVERKLFIGADKLVHRTVDTTVSEGKTLSTTDAVLSNIRTDFPDPADSLFTYTPPDGVKTDEEVYKDRLQLLPVGTSAPDYTLLTPAGKPVKLSSFRGKVVVIDFWATWCGPCVRSMPHTSKVARKFENRNVVILAVNVWDDESGFQSFTRAFPEYKPLVFLHDPRKASDEGEMAGEHYHVTGLPTQYIIDADGIIRQSSVGYDGENDDLENAILAAQKPLVKK